MVNLFKLIKTIIVSFFLVFGIVCIISSNGGGGGGGGDDGGSNKQIPSSFATKAIASEGGTISIVDEHNNTIEVVFPKDALEETAQITLQVKEEQPSFPIETSNIAVFEIMPYDLELGYPITVKVTYGDAIQNIQATALFRNKADILLPLADHSFDLDGKDVQAESFSLGVFAEGCMSVEQINTQVGLILSAYGVDWNSSDYTTADASISATNFIGMWKSYREDAKGSIELAIKYQLLGYFDRADELLASICSDILGPFVSLMLGGGMPEDPCEHSYTYTLLDVAILSQQIGCDSVDSQIGDQVQAIRDDCGCFTFNSSDKVNLTSILFIGGGTSISLYGNGTFSASSGMGATAGWWGYSGIGIMLTPDDEDLDTARLVLQRDMVCVGDSATLVIPAWTDEWGEYYPPESVSLRATDVQVSY